MDKDIRFFPLFAMMPRRIYLAPSSANKEAGRSTSQRSGRYGTLSLAIGESG